MNRLLFLFCTKQKALVSNSGSRQLGIRIGKSSLIKTSIYTQQLISLRFICIVCVCKELLPNKNRTFNFEFLDSNYINFWQLHTIYILFIIILSTSPFRCPPIILSTKFHALAPFFFSKSSNLFVLA